MINLPTFLHKCLSYGDILSGRHTCYALVVYCAVIHEICERQCGSTYAGGEEGLCHFQLMCQKYGGIITSRLVVYCIEW